MAKEKPNKWTREQGFFGANSGDIFTIAVVVVCAVISVLLVLTQWNMAGMMQDFFAQRAAQQASPQQPDIQSRPGETGMMLYPSKPPPK